MWLSVSGYVVGFANSLVRRSPWFSFPRFFEQVIDAYTRLLKAKKGEIDAIVTTAEPLTAPQEKALAAGLKAQVRCYSRISCPSGSYLFLVVFLYSSGRWGKM